MFELYCLAVSILGGVRMARVALTDRKGCKSHRCLSTICCCMTFASCSSSLMNLLAKRGKWRVVVVLGTPSIIDKWQYSRGSGSELCLSGGG